MKALIMVDMEGITGVDEAALTKSGSPEWLARGRQLATGDVVAAVEGTFQAGAGEVLVRDFHQAGCNVLTEKLPIGSTYLGGEALAAGPVPVFGVCDGSFGALVLVGLHPMAGAEGFMPHTLNSKVSALEINGRRVGEIGLFAGLAGYFGFPLVAVAGDEGAAKEVAELEPRIRTAITKRGGTPVSLVAPEAARELIRAAVQAGVSEAASGRIPAVSFAKPVTMEYTPSRTAGGLLNEIPGKVPGVRQTRSGSGLIWTSPDFLKAYMTLFQVHQRSGQYSRNQSK